MEKYITIALLTALMISFIIIYMCGETHESFRSHGEKADTIYRWFSTHPHPTYLQYRDDLRSESNIVEYSDALSLSAKPGFTAAALSQIL